MVQEPLDEKLKVILQFGKMVLQMKGGQGKHYKQFNRDNALAIHRTCNGIFSESCIIMFCWEHFQQIP